MIKINKLKKVYFNENDKIVALDEINLEVNKGDIFGIIGPSGAGKSSFIRCLNLLEEPTSGEIIIDEQDITTLNNQKLRNIRKEIGMIFQNFNLLKSRTVFQNVAFPLEIADKSNEEIKLRVSELLKLVGLSDKGNKYPNQLSGGQQQRVGIARALANAPKFLLCDEATSSLDPETTHSILDLLEKINQKLDITIILITHEMKVIKEICTKVAVLESGKIVESGDVLDIFTNPQVKVTKKFIQRVINSDIPTELLSRITVNGTLVKISFIGKAVGQPIISGLVHSYKINVNILYGNIDKIQNNPFGTLIIELTGSVTEIKAAIKELINTSQVKVRVIKNE